VPLEDRGAPRLLNHPEVDGIAVEDLVQRARIT
jgi:hypothetical protein